MVDPPRGPGKGSWEAQSQPCVSLIVRECHLTMSFQQFSFLLVGTEPWTQQQAFVASNGAETHTQRTPPVRCPRQGVKNSPPLWSPEPRAGRGLGSHRATFLQTLDLGWRQSLHLPLASERCQGDGCELGHGKVLGKSDAIIIHSLMFAWDGSRWHTDGGGFTPNG